MDYGDFLKSKNIVAVSSGFDVDKTTLNTMAFDWQKDIVRWALKKGKCALFEDCGLGKTLQQLMWAKSVFIETEKPVLIVSPLAVTQQTLREYEKFKNGENGIVKIAVIRGNNDVVDGINIINYEMFENIDMDKFSGIVLDESSILKSYTSSTKTLLIEKCQNIPFKLCCTATPSPNDYEELGNHSEFLGVMTRTEMLSTFFVHDGGDTSKWRLKGHAKDKFFAWVASWACCMTTPADLGYDGKDYQLPKLNIIEHIVDSGQLEDSTGQMMFIPQDKLTLNERREARRNSLIPRCEKAGEIANGTDEQVLVWCDLNSESEQLNISINDSKQVKGSDNPKYKVDTMQEFTKSELKCLISKPSIAGWGMNWQNCHNMIFVGLSDSFEAYYQAVRRCYRFGQKNEVNVHIIISDGEGCVKTNIERKQKDAETMTAELVKYTKDILKNDIKQTVRMTEQYFAFDEIIIPKWLVEETNYES